MAVILAILSIAIILTGNELWARRRNPHGEFSRKFVHISVGSMVAFWPFWFSWSQIEWLSLAFLIGIAISKQLNVFQAIHSVQRPTWGEFFFAAAVGGIALMTHDKWIYATALLQMSLADGFAAVFGIKYGKGQGYQVFGHDKSLVGSLTFFVLSLAILINYNYIVTSGSHLAALSILGISLLTTLIENLGVAGLDNLLVPLLVAAMLRAFA